MLFGSWKTFLGSLYFQCVLPAIKKAILRNRLFEIMYGWEVSDSAIPVNAYTSRPIHVAISLKGHQTVPYALSKRNALQR